MRFQAVTVFCYLLLTASPITARFFPNITSVPTLQLLNATRSAWDSFLKLAGSHSGDKLHGLSKLKQYFLRFGYISSATVGNFTDDFDEVLESAIRTYQKNFNLKVTGELDAATLRQIVRPRCGNADVIDGSTAMNAGKKYQTTAEGRVRIRTTERYSFFPGKPRWPEEKRDLIYAFVPQNNLTEEVKRVFSRAFDRWADVTPLRFTRSDSESLIGADIVIGFFTGDHGDGEPFDGAMGTLAHASSPPTGLLHLDGDEDWLISDGSGGEVGRRIFPVTSVVDLESVVVHEIGHLLGLGHSSVEDSIMYPTIEGGDRRVELSKDDIEGIKQLYGVGGSPSSDNSSRRRDTGDGGSSFIGGSSRWRGLSLLLAIGFLFLDL